MKIFLPFLFSFLYFFSTQGQTPMLEIWEIQGSGLSSPYDGRLVKTSGNVVTLVRNDRFFIQTPLDRSDNDPLSSDGIMVYVGNPFALTVGDYVTVTGNIVEYFGLTEFGPDDLSFQVDSSGGVLPVPFRLDLFTPSTEAESLPNLEKIEGMLVSFDNATATGPSDRDIGTISLHPFRPFREPGIKFPGISGLPVWDGNPEVLSLNMQGIPSSPISTGMKITGSGTLTYANGSYQIIAKEVDITGDQVLEPVRMKNDQEVTIGALNCFVFGNTAANFTARTHKIAEYVLTQLQAPDILAVQEVRNLITLEALAARINELDSKVDYSAHLIPSGGGGFQINVGFLVRKTVQDIAVSPLGENEVLSTGGTLHDRPPLLLEASFKTDPPTPITVLNLHLRSLGGIEGNNEDFVRLKRQEQAISVARMIQILRSDNLVVIGDYNALQFSDGYVDVLAQLTGEPSLGAEYEILPIVDPPLINQSLSVPSESQYSFIFNGNAQILDYCLTAELNDMQVSELQYARGNSDNPNTFLDNTFVPWRAADHDGLVLFLELESELIVGNNDVNLAQLNLSFPNPFLSQSTITISSIPGVELELMLFNALGRPILSRRFNSRIQEPWVFKPDVKMTKGIYFLKATMGSETVTKIMIVE